jgi:hypothetical protein
MAEGKILAWFRDHRGSLICSRALSTAHHRHGKGAPYSHECQPASFDSHSLNPPDEGFKLFRPDGRYAHTLYNRETNGWDRWRIVTDDQNYYARALSTEEKDFALQRGWKLSCVCALESGGGFSDVDFAGEGPRFDIEFLQGGDRYFVGLTKQISPTFDLDQKIEFAGVAGVDHPHTYQLQYDHVM